MDLTYIPNAPELSQKGRDIAKRIRQPTRELRKFPVGKTTYKDVLAIYRNNQQYYVQRLIQNGALSKEDIKGLNMLERKLVNIREPISKHASLVERNEHAERETSKLVNGYSDYCHKLLREFIDKELTIKS